MADEKTTAEAEESQLEAALETDVAAEPKPRRKRTASQEKKAADEARHKEALENTPRPEPDPELEASIARKAELRKEIEDAQGRVDELQGKIDAEREFIQAKLLELYPTQAESDRPVDAIRGYLNRQAEERKNRPANRTMIENLLKTAGKAPVDAAFHHARARGTQRPTRHLTKPGE